MNLVLTNFGGVLGTERHELHTMFKANGHGKTTLLNAYIFALSGKTINGFEPVNVHKNIKDITEVVLNGWLNWPSIRRVLTANGTTLYIAGDVVTQTDFVRALANEGYDLDFICACADANALASDGLDTETLRKLLTRLDVIKTDEYDKLKKQATELRKQIKTAEQYALNNVIVPARTIKPLSEAEKVFMTTYQRNILIVNEGVQGECTTCGRAYEAHTLKELNDIYDAAVLAVERDKDEAERIASVQDAFNKETGKIAIAQTLIDDAQRARLSVQKLTKQLNDIEEQLKTLDLNEISNALPDGVKVITEQQLKNGSTKPTCTLEWDGVPLKSINHAKRVEICVYILDYVRKAKGMKDVPIIVDNAEAISHAFEDIDNVILLIVC